MNQSTRAGRQPRRQIMIDQYVQGALIRRVALYWGAALASSGLFTWVAWVWLPSPGLTAGHVLLGAAGSVLVMPWAVADVLRVSHRFVGPVHAVRNALKRHSLGDSIAPLEARRGDAWQDLVARVNQTLGKRDRR